MVLDCTTLAPTRADFELVPILQNRCDVLAALRALMGLALLVVRLTAVLQPDHGRPIGWLVAATVPEKSPLIKMTV